MVSLFPLQTRETEPEKHFHLFLRIRWPSDKVAPISSRVTRKVCPRAQREHEEGGLRCVHIKCSRTRWGLRQGERGGRVEGVEREERQEQGLHEFLQPLLVNCSAFTWEASSAVQQDASEEKELHIWSLWRVRLIRD